VSASRSDRFSPREEAPDTHWLRGWVGPKAGLDDVEKRNFLILQGLELRPLGSPARSLKQSELAKYWSIYSIRDRMNPIKACSLFNTIQLSNVTY
jgi:hypothetical protein